MVSRMTRDSLESWVRDHDSWVRDHNIDGFRFDLTGSHHHKNVDDWAGHLNATFPDRTLQIHGLRSA